MTEIKHTPGPWEVVSGAVYAQDGRPIAKMDRESGNGISPVERDANAHFIASAPDMAQRIEELEAVNRGLVRECETVIEWCKEKAEQAGLGYCLDDIIEESRLGIGVEAALRKAQEVKR